MKHIEPLANLIENFRSLPGIGQKTATRLAYFILDMDNEKARSLAQSILQAKEKIGFCHQCFNLSDQSPCEICQSIHRDQTTICVVEQPQDVAAIERMHDYKGVYHVLHGVLSPLDGISPEDLRIRELLFRIKKAEETQPIKEIIMALNATVEGEATAMYIAKMLKPFGVKVTQIAHGLPVGSDLELADEMTLAKAIQNRIEL